MKSICFFCSYYPDGSLPFYVKFYLNELCNHFTEVVFLTNEKTLSPEDAQYLHSKNIIYRIFKNEGYDFGMWYKAFQEFDITQYNRVALVNDSCILFNKLDFYFDWLNKQEIDYSGFTDYYDMGYHIQSYFIIINKRAIPHVAAYFNKNGIVKNFKDVIKIYEVNLCIYLKENGMCLKVYFPSIKNEAFFNPTWYGAKELIKKGLPLVKKKIIIREYGDADWKNMTLNGFDPIPNHYIRLIKKVSGKHSLINEIFESIMPSYSLKNRFNLYWEYYNLIILYSGRKSMQLVKNLFRPSYRFVKGLLKPL